MEEVTISGEATAVPAKAFYGSTALKSITLGEKITDVGNRAFFECPAITTVTSYAAVPPTAVTETFDQSIFTTATLYVYNISLDAYKEATIWKNFYSVQPLDPNSGIDKIEYDKPVTVYTVSGIMISQNATTDYIFKLPRGTYIINGKKVMIK